MACNKEKLRKKEVEELDLVQNRILINEKLNKNWLFIFILFYTIL